MIIAAVGPSAFNIIFAVAVASSPAIARIVQSRPRLKSREFVAAARLGAIGVVHHAGGDPAEREGSADRRHLHPGGLRGLHDGTLSFLGLGIRPPTPWGGMVSAARNWILIAPWVAAFPASRSPPSSWG